MKCGAMQLFYLTTQKKTINPVKTMESAFFSQSYLRVKYHNHRLLSFGYPGYPGIFTHSVTASLVLICISFPFGDCCND